MKPLLREAKEGHEKEAGDGKHRVMLTLDKDDYDKLRILVDDVDTNNNDVLRRCLRNQFEVNMQHKRQNKSGAV